MEALIVYGGGILLQFYLSRRKSKWPGLVLPAFIFLSSLRMVYNMVSAGVTSGGNILPVIVSGLVIGNMPSLILVLIYISCRGKKKPEPLTETVDVKDTEEKTAEEIQADAEERVTEEIQADAEEKAAEV